MTDLLAFLMDVSLIVGGFLLAAGAIVNAVPALKKAYNIVKPFSVIVGGVAIAMGSYWVIRHVTNGERLYVFEIVGLIVGMTLLADFWRKLPVVGEEMAKLSGGLKTFQTIIGIVGIIVGILGLVTQNG